MSGFISGGYTFVRQPEIVDGVEVSGRMVEAGLRALYDSAAVEVQSPSDQIVVAEIYVAMAKIRDEQLQEQSG